MSFNFNSLNGIYRTFQSTDEMSVDKLSNRIPTSYKRIIGELLFPSTGGFYYSSEELWRQIYGLSTSIKDDKEAYYKIANLLRVYHYGPGSESIENEIKSFYTDSNKGARPSAYKAITTDSRGKTSYSYTDASLRNLIKKTSPDNLSKSKLTVVLVDSQAIDFKLRNAQKTEIFLNYFSPVSMMRAVPYLEATFMSKRKKNSQAANENLYHMSPLRFLLGPHPNGSVPTKGEAGNAANRELFQPGSANALLYDSSKYAVKNLTIEDRSSTQIKTIQTGMEMFTMPQTLVNMDYDQETNPRFNPIINPTVPFGTITSFSTGEESSVQVSSFKRATLILKIFDRSRLPEIADFLNPELYTSLSIIVTYGWVAPLQPVGDDITAASQSVIKDEYSDFINKNMLISETFGVANSNVALDNSGVATVTFTLFTKGGAELQDITPTGESLLYESKQSDLPDALRRLRIAAQELGITTFTTGDIKDIRASQVLGVVGGNSIPELKAKEFEESLTTIENLLRTSAPNAPAKIQAFLKDLRIYFDDKIVDEAGAKVKKTSQIDAAVKTVYDSRFSKLDLKHDMFAYSFVKNNKGKTTLEKKFDGDNAIAKKRQENHPLEQGDLTFLNSSDYVSFGNLFTTFFSTACSGITSESGEPLIDDYQIFFYNLNEDAGPVGNLNIAEFPISKEDLEKFYTKRIIEMKGEHMSLETFLQIVRESQFADTRHPAYGFRDYFLDKNGKPSQQVQKTEAYLKKIASVNQGPGRSGGPFRKPEIDFHIESGFEKVRSETNKRQSLLQTYQINAASNTGNTTYNQQVKRILRVHIYDKQACPHKFASTLLKATVGQEKRSGLYRFTGKYDPDKEMFVEQKNIALEAIKKVQGIKGINQVKNTNDIKNPQTRTKAENSISSAQAAAKSYEASANAKIQKYNAAGDGGIDGSNDYQFFQLTDDNGRPRFELTKRALSALVPTIFAGAQGSMIKNISYSSETDQALATIQIIRNIQDPETAASGTSTNELPVTVIPGKLNITCLGCPIIEYMQQYFVDLGTGTTMDNLYNVIKVNHSLSPGKFTTDIGFGFYDAYGSYESAKNLGIELQNTLDMIQSELRNLPETTPPNKPLPATAAKTKKPKK